MSDSQLSQLTSAQPIGWGLIWTLVALLIVLLEGIALGRPATAGDTLSDAVRGAVRFDPVGRFVFLPLWCWLTWHWVLRPRAIAGESWRDALAIAVGLAWAAIEAWLYPGGL
jgi:hypothetical protein